MNVKFRQQARVHFVFTFLRRQSEQTENDNERAKKRV